MNQAIVKEKMLYLNPDVLLHIVDGFWVASNPRLRVHVGLDAAAFSVLGIGAAGQEESVWQESMVGITGCDRTQRGLGEKGLHADHSGLAEGPGPKISGADLFNLLRQRRVLIASDDEAFDQVRPLSSPLDIESLGSFHQRVGQRLLLQRQREPWRAWQNQKFSENGMELRPGPYQRIQEPHFEAYFTHQRLAGKRVLDFGCGNGYFSARMASKGAQVLALDNSSELLSMARRNHGNEVGLEFLETPSFDAVLARCAAEPAGSFDFITLQDTLLLLLQPESGLRSSQLLDVFRAFHRLLKPEGILCAMEPNAVFWLASRYGHRDRPYAVISEYYKPLFHVAPSMETLLCFMAEAGFALTAYRHPRPTMLMDADGDFAYQSQFPIWDFFEFIPRIGGRA